jgi:hypothetical protein
MAGQALPIRLQEVLQVTRRGLSASRDRFRFGSALIMRGISF